jgi:hypothetical protein
LLSQTRHWIWLLKIGLGIQIWGFFVLVLGTMWWLFFRDLHLHPQIFGLFVVSLIWIAGWVALIYHVLRDKFLPRRRALEELLVIMD